MQQEEVMAQVRIYAPAVSVIAAQSFAAIVWAEGVDFLYKD